MTMKMPRSLLVSCGMALALGLSGAAMAQQALTEHQVRTRLDEKGYTKVNDLKFKDGVWKADARSAEGKHVDVRMDPKTGEIYPDEQVANLSERDVRAQLSAAGYLNVHDVDYESGV